jgi:hypothetical protein
MEDLAEFTGGDVVQISSAEITAANRAQLDKLAARITRQVETFYRVEVALSPVERAARVKLSFADRDRKRISGSIAYSRQIAACPPPQGTSTDVTNRALLKRLPFQTDDNEVGQRRRIASRS